MLYVFGFTFIIVGFLILIIARKCDNTDDNNVLYSIGIFTISEGVVVILISLFIIGRF